MGLEIPQLSFVIPKKPAFTKVSISAKVTAVKPETRN